MRLDRILSRNRSWLLPFAGSIIAWAATVIIAAMRGKRDYSVTTGAITMALLCAMVVGLALTSRNARHTWRRWRRRRRDESAERRRQADVDAAWKRAHVLATGLAEGKALSPLAARNLILQPGETAHVDVPLECRLMAPAWLELRGDRVVCTTERICVQSYDRWRTYIYKEIAGARVTEPELTFALHFAAGVRLVLRGRGAPVVAAYVTWTLASRQVDTQS